MIYSCFGLFSIIMAYQEFMNKKNMSWLQLLEFNSENLKELHLHGAAAERFIRRGRRMSPVFVFLLAYMPLLSYFFFCFVFLRHVYERFGLILGLIHSAFWALAAFYLAALIYGMMLIFGQVSYYFQLRFNGLNLKLRYIRSRYYGNSIKRNSSRI